MVFNYADKWDKSGALRWVLPALLAAAWWIASHCLGVPGILLPTPESVAVAFATLASDGTLLHHIQASAMRSMGGFALACAAGIPLALLNAASRRSGEATCLVLEAVRVTPPLSLVPLLILWLGIGEAPKIAIVFLSSFFPIYMNALTAARSVDPKLEEVARLLRFTPAEKFRMLTVPSAAPGLLTGLRLGFGYSWRALVGAELVAASSGLGFLISESAEFAKTETVFVGILSIVVLGIAADALFSRLATLAARRCGRLP